MPPNNVVLNSLPDTAQNYRGLLVAKITSKNLPTSGPLNGRKVYEWTEQSLDTTNGSNVDPQDSPPRKGVYASAVEYHNCILDANDAELTINSFVWARFKGLVSGIAVYETVNVNGLTYNVRLVASGTGVDGGTAWDAIIQVEDDTGHVVDGDHLGPSSNRYVLYASKGFDGSTGSPAANDRAYAVPNPKKAGRWLFIPKVTSSGGGDCSSDAWLKYAQTVDADGKPTCWTIYRRGGAGRCSGFPSDDTSLDENGDPVAGITAVYTGVGGWLGVRGNGTTTSAMIETPCGCGSVKLTISPTAASGSRATLTLGGVHVSCNAGSGSGGGAVYTETLSDYCTGTLPDGRRYILFSGSSADSCDGTPQQCDNTYQIMAVCQGRCPPLYQCGCIGCTTTVAPIAWYGQYGGFTDDHLNGDWVYVPSDPDDPCAYTAECMGVTSTLEYVPGTPAKWRVTHGTAVYEKDVADGDCANDDVTFSLVSGSGPESISLDTIRATIRPTCCGGCNYDEVKAKSLSFTISGPGFGTQSGGFTYFPDENLWRVFGGTADECDSWSLVMACADGRFVLSAVTAYGGISTTAQLATSCDPFLLEASGANVHIPGCTDGAVTVSISE